MTIHVVQEGETVSSIAGTYGVNPQRLAADNTVPADGSLAVGQTLVVRISKETHTVKAGETLSSIATAYRITTRKLWQNNWSLGGGTTLSPGQELVISYSDEILGSAAANGYAYPFINRDLLRAEVPFLTNLTPFTYGITAQGGLLPLDDEELLAIAWEHGTRPVMHLSSFTENNRFDTERAAMVLTDDAVQSKLITEIQQNMQRKGFVGLDVDFEFLPANLADAYAAFLAKCRQQLSSQGYFVWAALAPKTFSNQPGLLYEGHDYAKIGAAVDAVLLMTYEWGYTYGPPMAVAPMPNVRAVLDYAVTVIPPAKILLGVPNYGYDWPLPFQAGITKAESISNQQAIQLAIQYNIAIQYDATAQSPYFYYTDPAGTAHAVWFEDARSMSAKLRLIAEYKFKGCGFWNIMRPFSQTWLTLVSLYNIG